MKKTSLFIVIAVCCVLVGIGLFAIKHQPEIPNISEKTDNDEFTAGGKPVGFWVARVSDDLSGEELKATVDALTLALAARDGSVRVAAADAIAVLGPQAKDAVSALIGQLDHEQGWVRVSASGALAAIGKDAVEPLIETFKNETGAVRIRAAFALGGIGPAAKDAAAILAEAMEHEDELTRIRFLGILGQIDPERYAPSGEISAAKFDSIEMTQSTMPTFDAAASGDWPGFHGPSRDSICRDTGLLETWPEDGLKLLWKVEGLGGGFSSVSIADGRLFTMGDLASDDEMQSQFIIALDVKTGGRLWATPIGPGHDDGPRCTPTVDGGLVYALGTQGDLVCLDAATGAIRWQKSLPDDFGGMMMSGWKYSESPLLDGNKVICTPGGNDAAMIALDKLTGATIWTCKLPEIGDEGVDGGGYSSAVTANIHGVRQYVQMLGRGVIGVDAETGRFLWGYNRIANTIANITSPVVRGNYVFVTTAYNTGAALVKVVREDGGFGAREVYFIESRDFQNQHGGVVLIDGYIYGGHGANRGDPTCIELATGKVAWQKRSEVRGSASVLYADGNVLFRYDRGDLILAEATPQAFVVKGRFKPVCGEGPAWAHPVIHNGRLYLRHCNILSTYDLRALK